MKLTKEQMDEIVEKYSKREELYFRVSFQDVNEIEDLCKLNKELNYKYRFFNSSNLFDVRCIKVLLRNGYQPLDGIYCHDDELLFVHKSYFENNK